MNKLYLIILCVTLFFTSITGSAQKLINSGDQWSYFKGTKEPSQPMTYWTNPEYNASNWLKGNTPFRYGDGSGGTLLSDMQDNYTTLYLRKEFDVADKKKIDLLIVSVNYDDGFAIWINDELVLQNNTPEYFAYNSVAPNNHESGEFVTYILEKSKFDLVNGKNIITVQGFNVTTTSSDFYQDITVEGIEELASEGNISINKPSGFYSNNFTAEISSSNPGENIRYTLDGSDPRYSATVITASSPVNVSINPSSTEGERGRTGGVVLRASIYKEGFAPSKPITQTYLFLRDVITQGHPGGNWPTNNVNGQVIDLPMDPDITNDARYKDLMASSLLDIPTISVTTDQENLFGSEKGIYVNASYHGIEWERPANIELINTDGSLGFNIDAGIRIRGGWSRHDGYPKHAFRLFFRSEYGEGKLEYPLFGEEGADEFDKIDLRTSQNYSWANGGGNSRHNTMNRDVFSRDSQKDMNRPHTRSRYYHLYLNGLYWGVYQTQERGEAAFAETYFGGDKEDYDVIKIDVGESFNVYEVEATDGNLEAWEDIWDMSQQGFSSNLNYFKLLGLNYKGEEDTSKTVWVDVDNLIDYMITIFYGGNFDSPVSKFSSNRNPNNFFAIYDRTKKREGFKFLAHDAEHSLLTDAAGPGIGLEENRVNIGSTQENRMNVTYFGKFHPQWLHFKLSFNKEYRLRFADRVYRHFFNNGVFTPESCISRFKKTSDLLDLAIIAESAKWGHFGGNPPRNKIDDWIPAIDRVTNDYMPFRSEIVLNQLLEENLYVNQEPPIFKNEGTEIVVDEIIISGNYNLTIINPVSSGSVIYTTDGTDPRNIGGSQSNTATDGGKLKEIVVRPGTLLKARVKYGTIWSALHEINFEDSGLFSNLKVTEVHYHPTDQDTVGGKQLEFIELKNIGSTTLDISGLTFTDGISYTFPNGTTLSPKTFVVVASNPLEFQRLYGFSTDHGYSGSLSNGGERVTLETSTNEVVIDFTYYDTIPWPEEADGDGFSLISLDINPKGDPNLVEYWTSSKYVNGSPATDDEKSITAAPVFVSNEFKLDVYPNPTNSSLNIDFTLDNNEHIEIGLYDLNGRLLQSIVSEQMPEGNHNKSMQLTDLNITTGMYLIAFKSKSSFVTKKLIYNK